MKYFVFIASSLVVLLSGCVMPLATIPYSDMTPDEACTATYREITYVADPHHGGWQTATETLSKGTGDCEDFAIVMVYKLQGRGRMVAVKGTYVDHVVVLVDGRYYDPTTGYSFDRLSDRGYEKLYIVPLAIMNRFLR